MALGRNNGVGVAGLIGGGGLWMFSAFCLAVAMRYNLAASELSHWQGTASRLALTHLHGVAVAWAFGFTLFQVASGLAWTFVIRAAWRLRAAVCYTVGAAMVMAGDCFGLFCLLAWLRLTSGSN